MKFTSKDLMKTMGLRVGDRVKVEDRTKRAINEYTIISLENEEVFYEREGKVLSLVNLVGRDYEILPRPKKVGFVECTKENCKKCPIQFACKMFSKNPDIDWDCGCQATRYITLDLLNIQDQEIYDLLKARLDKVVEE